MVTNRSLRVEVLMLALMVCIALLIPKDGSAFCRQNYGPFEVTIVRFPPPAPDNYDVDVYRAQRHPADGGGLFNFFGTVPWGTSSVNCLPVGRYQFQAIDAEEGELPVYGPGPDTPNGFTDYDVTCAPDDEIYSGVSCSGSVTIEMHKSYTRQENNPSHRPRFSTSPSPPCPAVGKPVNVVTGNMFLDQTDAVVPGWGPGLNLARSYNSGIAYWGYQGAFGTGWTHTYEKQLEVMETAVLMIRESNGVATFYWDSDGDQTFEPFIPATEKSWVIKSGGTYTRNFPDGSHETYDGSGNLTSTVDAVGNTVSLTYASEKLASVTDPAGRQLTFTYSGAHITSASGPGGPIAVYTYSGNNLESVTYPDQSGYSFLYSAAGRLTQVADHEGVILEKHTYAGYRSTSSEIGDGQELYTLEYLPNQTKVTDALGNLTTYDWEERSGVRYVTRISGPCSSCGTMGGESQEWRYDDEGRVLSHTDGLGNTATYAYDENGYTETETDPLDRTTSYINDSQGRVLTRTDAAGGITTWKYGPSGPLTITDAIQRTTTLTYHPRGKPETITDPRQQKISLGYDVEGNLISVTDPLGNQSKYGYDLVGRRTSITDPLGNATTIEYDSQGRVKKIINPDATFIRFAYDRGGRRTSVTDPLGRPTQFGYDTFGRLETVTEPLAGVTTYGYDLMSNITSITDAAGKVTHFAYDGYRRVEKITYPKTAGEADRVETFSYDPAGRLEVKTKKDGTTVTRVYDAAGQLTEKSAATAQGGAIETLTYDYDDAGRMIFAAGKAWWDELSWTYDLAGQVLSESFGGLDATVSYSYDPAGNRKTVTLNGELFATYDYDDAGRLAHLYRGAKVFTFAYDAASRRTSLSYPNGAVTTYDYDTLSRLTGVTTKRGSTLIAQAGYTLDDAGNRLTKTTESYVESYAYDDLDRLESVTRDALQAEHYTYDPVGNRLSALGLPGWSYNVRNELESFNGTSFAYDLNGNRLSKTDATGKTTYRWDWNDRLRRVTTPAGPVTYAYDSLGRRIWKGAASVGRAQTTYIYDGMDILKQTNRQTGASFTFIHGPGIDEPLAAENHNGKFFYIHADGLGSLVKVTDDQGQVIHTKQYDAFGNIQIGASQDAYAFTGREWDPETGLYYYRARYYDPEAGRFISEDPIGFYGGVNLYTYVANTPTRWADPLGLSETDPSHEGSFWEQAELWVEGMKGKVAGAATHLADEIAAPLDSYWKGLGTHTKTGAAAIVEGGFAALEGLEALLEFLKVMKEKLDRNKRLCDAFPELAVCKYEEFCPPD